MKKGAWITIGIILLIIAGTLIWTYPYENIKENESCSSNSDCTGFQTGCSPQPICINKNYIESMTVCDFMSSGPTNETECECSSSKCTIKDNPQQNNTGCLQEGELHDAPFLPPASYSSPICCEGLAFSNYCSQDISIGEKCYILPENRPKAGGCHYKSCIKCGDNKCGEHEDICNCPEDCIGEKTPDFTLTHACEVYGEYCETETEYEDTNLCSIC